METDFIIQNEGSIYLFTPVTPAAAAHIEENVSDEAQWYGASLVVEHRYAADLAEQLQQEGFTLS